MNCLDGGVLLVRALLAHVLNTSVVLDTSAIASTYAVNELCAAMNSAYVRWALVVARRIVMAYPLMSALENDSHQNGCSDTHHRHRHIKIP